MDAILEYAHRDLQPLAVDHLGDVHAASARLLFDDVDGAREQRGGRDDRVVRGRDDRLRTNSADSAVSSYG